MKPKIGIVVFPGSNCDHDAYYVTKKVLGCESEFLWHKENNLKNSDIIILPGGFSYGDYLRTGSIARFSPIMESVVEFAEKGGIVLGICNGFQILVEAKLLPGTLLQNESIKFVCKDVYLKVVNTSSLLTNNLPKNVLKVPVAHGEGNYFIDKDSLKELEKFDQILFKYCDESGNTIQGNNPNGSIENIAGVMNKRGNVFGMMPHPERCSDKILGNEDGKLLFEALFNNFINKK